MKTGKLPSYCDKSNVSWNKRRHTTYGALQNAKRHFKWNLPVWSSCSSADTQLCVCSNAMQHMWSKPCLKERRLFALAPIQQSRPVDPVWSRLKLLDPRETRLASAQQMILYRRPGSPSLWLVILLSSVTLLDDLGFFRFWVCYLDVTETTITIRAVFSFNSDPFVLTKQS